MNCFAAIFKGVSVNCFAGKITLTPLKSAEIAPDRATVMRLLAATSRNIADAKLAALSANNRFDAVWLFWLTSKLPL